MKPPETRCYVNCNNKRNLPNNEGNLLNSFYEARKIRMPKPDKGSTKKGRKKYHLWTLEHKYSKENIREQNPNHDKIQYGQVGFISGRERDRPGRAEEWENKGEKFEIISN